ncbi:MAG: antibiotic biosynthesis monooxygenase family protein [Bacteroidota bacterium]
MIKRIVKLTFKEEYIPIFLALFEASKDQIRAFEGCEHLELWRAKAPSNTLFTYSYWKDEDALNRYRKSDFFAMTWKKTKALFEERAEAWSIDVVEVVV